MTKESERTPAPRSTEIEAFLAKARALEVARTSGGRGRLVFAIDAKVSTTDLGYRLSTTESDVRGSGRDWWARYSACLLSGAPRVRFFTLDRRCTHTRWPDGKNQLPCWHDSDWQGARRALVFVGDAMEETAADLCAAARELGLPVFLFQEGDDPEATRVFREIARLTNGAYCRFDPGSARQLAELLRAVAVYAAGGRRALLASGNAGAVKLLAQLKEG
jgi:hypothetical protein